jgi:hypothetical protein
MSDVTTDKTSNAQRQAEAQLSSIVEMMTAFFTIAEANGSVKYDGETIDVDRMRELIEEDPLSVQVRGDWHQPGAKDEGPAFFEILLSTGGPAVRITGTLGADCEPDSAQLEYQDWFTPWMEYTDIEPSEVEALLEYCRVFWFGE